MLVRVSLAQQKSAQAIEMLERWSHHLDQPGDIETAIQFLALQVVALHQAGKREQAARVAARLLALTEPEGYIRVYLDAGLPMKHVLKAFWQPCKMANPLLQLYPFPGPMFCACWQPSSRRRAGPHREEMHHLPPHTRPCHIHHRMPSNQGPSSR